MHSWRFRLLFVFVLLFVVPRAKADTVIIDGTYASASNGYGIPPYGGTLNGQKESFYCVDFASSIAPPYSWNVNITSLTGSSFSLTKLNNQTTYLEMAWLITQMMGTTSQLQKAMDQFAIWSFTGGPDPYGTNKTLAAAAFVGIKGFNAQGWVILTPTGSAGQEFLIYVSEPSTILLLGVALLALGVMGSRRLL